MKNKYILSAIFFYSTYSFAQVGINTTTPTEKLDVNGTLRVRTLPNSGETNSIYTTGPNSSTNTPTQTFNAGRPMVTDANGVMGITTFSDLVPNSTLGATAFNTTNTSSAMFVVKRFNLMDDVGGTIGRYHPNYAGGTTAGIFNGDTGMKVSDWQPIISNISFKFRNETTNTGAQFIANNYYNYRVKGTIGGTWRIVGDILNMQEEAYVDVLFIRSSVVASDDRYN